MDKELDYINYCIAENKCRINKLDTMGFTDDFKKQYGDYLFKERERLNAIKQALLKAQEQKKALKIIKEKKIDVVSLCCSLDAESYNLSVEVQGLNDTFKITQEEFDLVKEMLKCI